MTDHDRRYRVLRLVQRFVVEPPVRLVWWLGVATPGDAELETTGRRTGRPRRTRICDGLVGTTVWVVAQHGRRTDYVRNIEADPRVRIRVRGRWRTGTAHLLPDDDPHERQRMLSHRLTARLNAALVRTWGTDLLTVRIDLDD